MLKAAMLITFIALNFAIWLSGCISLNIGGSEAKRASGVTYSEPAAPFKRESRDDVDMSWRQQENGSAISFLSDCQDTSDPELNTIANGVLSGLGNVVYESNEALEFSKREARRILAHGKVDGVPTHVDLLVFKKNRCIYVLTYVAVSKVYKTNVADFEKFLKGFNPP